MNKWLLAVITSAASFIAGWATHSLSNSHKVTPIAGKGSPSAPGTTSHSVQLPDLPAKQDGLDDFKRAAAAAITNSSPRAKLRDFLPILEELTPEKASALLPIIGKMTWRGVEDTVCVHLFLSRWGELDPETALKEIKEYKEELFGGPLSVMAGWAMNDLAGLMSYAGRMEPQSADRGLAVLGVITALSKRDLEEAGDYFLSQPDLNDPKMKESLLNMMWRARDIDRLDLAITWFERAPEGSAKSFLASYTSELLEKKDPTVAQAFKSRPDVLQTLTAK